MRNQHIAPLVLLLATLLLAGSVEARSAGTEAQTTSPAAADTAEPDALSTGSIAPPYDKKKRFEDCMAIWEPATHMTKKEWRRTCNSQLDGDPSL
jgi:hypothetical protein